MRQEYLSQNKAAKYVGMSLYRFTTHYADSLPRVKLGNKIAYSKTVLDEFAKAHPDGVDEIIEPKQITGVQDANPFSVV